VPLFVVLHDGVITDHCSGLLTTLTGLNIRGNPLEFPPLEVRNKGSRMVLTFLKAVLEAKLSGQPEPTGQCIYSYTQQYMHTIVYIHMYMHVHKYACIQFFLLLYIQHIYNIFIII